MVREAELDEVREQVKKAAEIDLDKEFAKTVDPTGSLAESLRPPELDLNPPAPAPKALESAPAAPKEEAEPPAAPAAEPQPPKAASG
jgi:sec-independent protein translocase protein TatB